MAIGGQIIGRADKFLDMFRPDISTTRVNHSTGGVSA